MIQKTFDLFLPVFTDVSIAKELDELATCNRVQNIYVWSSVTNFFSVSSSKVKFLPVEQFGDTSMYVDMAERAHADYVVALIKELNPLPSLNALLRMCDAMVDNSSMLYSDYSKTVNGVCEPAPAIDYQFGSLRNDFDFGSVVVYRTSALKGYILQNLEYTKYAGFYQLRLAMSRMGNIQHLAENLYTAKEPDARKSGEKQFDYVNPAQRNVQVEMESVCTAHLKSIGGYLTPFKYTETDLSIGDFPVEASVVIPVLNRASTIADAIRSVLAQKCSFAFNILVVDNYSTDETGKIVDSFNDERVRHIVPEQFDLGIGGCWNLAVNSEYCGRFAVQLDSDDLYSDENTLQRVVDGFYEQRCAMLIGSYRICNFDLETLPPGIIDHREWSEENGRNNALRINGLGAPRAFFTPVIREVGFPNVSYGEDYAVGLQISRNYRIGRIYDVLYLCRRWGGNSDAALSHQKVNMHNYYKDSLRTNELNARMALVKRMQKPSFGALTSFFDNQLNVWPHVAERFSALERVSIRNLDCGVVLQYNPDRIVSAAAKVDDKSIEKRPCFLCRNNRPKEQITEQTLVNVEVLVNPYPILPYHFTLPLDNHVPQCLISVLGDMLALAKRWNKMAIFYNGAKCGASAPDHAHLQAVRATDIPLLGKSWRNRLWRNSYPVFATGGNIIYRITSYIVPLYVVESVDADSSITLIKRFMRALPLCDNEKEPRINVLSVYRKGKGYLTYIFPRAKHRPACYLSASENRRMISPGLLDMAGLVITPLKEDFETISEQEVVSILREVAIDENMALDVEQNLNE